MIILPFFKHLCNANNGIVKNLKKCFSGLLLMLLTQSVFSQEAVTASGGVSTGEGTVTYTVGQVFYNFISDGDYSISQGVQQPFEIYSDGGSDNIELIYSIYPNPTVDFVTLKIRNYNHQKLHYKIFNTNGKLIKITKISDDTTKIDMNYLASAIYYIIVLNDMTLLKTFKIIKN